MSLIQVTDEEANSILVETFESIDQTNVDHFRGVYTSELNLPVTASSGDYADVDSGVGLDITRYIWDDNDSVWILQSSAGGSETAISVKQKYESNANTNEFNDLEKAKLLNQSGINTGDQVLPTDTDDIAEAGNLYFTDARVSANADVNANILARHLHPNLLILDAITASFTIADENKLDNVNVNATVNSDDSVLLARANHTGFQNASTINAGVFADARISESSVLNHQGAIDALLLDNAPLEADAEANNISDAQVLDLTDGGESNAHFHSADRSRANHTGTQLLSTISDAGTLAALSIVASAQIQDANVIFSKLQDSGAVLGSYTNPNITINEKGIITSISSGGGGGGNVAFLDNGTLLTSALQSLDVIGGGVTIVETTPNNIQMTIAAGGAPVDSVNGQTGTVILGTDQITEGTNLYYTEARVNSNSNVSANSLARHTHSNQAILDLITDPFLVADRTKLNGIALGATVNATNAQLRDRTTHTGFQAASTINSGTFAVGRISEASVTQHQAAINALSLDNAPAEALADVTTLSKIQTELANSQLILPQFPIDTNDVLFYLDANNGYALTTALVTGTGVGGGDSWGDSVDDNIVPDFTGSRFIGTTLLRFDTIYSIDLNLDGNIVMNGTITGVTNLEPAFSKNSGFNLALGAAAGTVTEGNDSRLSDARVPLAHGHTPAEVGADPIGTDNSTPVVMVLNGLQFVTWTPATQTIELNAINLQNDVYNVLPQANTANGNGYPAIRTVTGVSESLAIGDAGNLIETNNAAANDLEVPDNATVAFTVGSKIDVTQYGAGLTTITFAVGVTLIGDVISQGQGKAMTLIQRAIDEWYVIGGTT